MPTSPPIELQAALRGAHLDSKVAELTLIDAPATCLARQVPRPPSEAINRLESRIERMFLEGNKKRSPR